MKKILWFLLALAVVPASVRADTSPAPVGAGVMGEYESDSFLPGVRLFLDRDYKLQEAPEWLLGRPFVRGSIAGLHFRCTRAGVATILSVNPSSPRAASPSLSLEARGFARVDGEKIFQLFGTSDVDQAGVYQKRMESGEEIWLGKWAVLVDPESVTKWQPRAPVPWTENDGELLYNGIRLPGEWPPHDGDPKSDEPMEAPYLEHPPKVIPIAVGRQLFVDDFLIEQTDLERTFHPAEKYEGNPVFKAETSNELAPPAEGERGQEAVTYLGHGGVFFDPRDKVFKMFYTAGWRGGLALATSRDLRRWIRPDIGLAGGNLLLPPGKANSGWDNCVWLDAGAERPETRLKFLCLRSTHELQASTKGREWSKPVPVIGGRGDYSSFFFNPFRNVWVFSVKGDGQRGRNRYYSESADFLKGADWSKAVYWTNADRLDLPNPQIGDAPQLYTLNAVAYESILLGEFAIHLGPKNEVCAAGKFPKITEIKLGFSRDGFHWERPDRRPFIAATRTEGSWDRGYLHGTAGVCVVLDDKLWFPYTGFSGIAPGGARGIYCGASIGLATLRRDGFASMDAGEKPGTLTTRPVVFTGKNLFVNINAPQGELRVEILDEANRVIAPFSTENCEPVAADKTLQAVRWKGAENLSPLAGRPVKFRFHLTHGKLYAFWVSKDETGRSDGYVAGGGPGFTGPTDTAGIGAPGAEN